MRSTSVSRAQLTWDIALTVVLVAVLVGEAVVETGGNPAAIASAAAMCLAVLFRRRFPLVAYVVSSVGLLCLVIWFYEAGLYPVANAVSIYSVGAYATRVRAVIGLVVGVAGVSWYWLVAPSEEILALPAIVLGAWVLTWAAGQFEAQRRRDDDMFRARAEDAERLRQAELASAVATERGRIAREVHDIVGHALNVMVLQAGAGRRMLGRDVAAVAGALGTVEQVGRDALADLDNVLAILGADTELRPAPGIGDLDDLAARFNDSGVPVELTVRGTPKPLSRSTQLTVYRVVQEALTNVAKHADGQPAKVRLEYEPDRIRVQVSDTGPGSSPNGSGRGLIGIRERVTAAGGVADAGPDPDGGWSVHATIPVVT